MLSLAHLVWVAVTAAARASSNPTLPSVVNVLELMNLISPFKSIMDLGQIKPSILGLGQFKVTGTYFVVISDSSYVDRILVSDTTFIPLDGGWIDAKGNADDNSRGDGGGGDRGGDGD